MEIGQFFRNLEKDIRSARTRKALKILNKRVKKFVKEIEESPIVNPRVKKDLLKKYRKSMKLIKSKEKSVSR